MTWIYGCVCNPVVENNDTRWLNDLISQALERSVIEITHEWSRCKSLSARIDLFTYVEDETSYQYLTAFKCYYHTDKVFDRYGGAATIFVRKIRRSPASCEPKESFLEVSGDYRIGLQNECEDAEGNRLAEVEQQLRKRFSENLRIILFDTDFIIT